MKKNWKFLALFGLGVVLLSGTVSYGVARWARPTSESVWSNPNANGKKSANEYGFIQAVDGQNGLRAVGSAPDLVPAAQRSVPAVVHIRVTGEQQVDQMTIDPFEFFFGGGGGFNRPQSQPTTSFGSGVIISTDGYIITNNHVIEGAREIEVHLNDNSQYTAKLIGSDPGTDIALLKIEADNLPTIPFGDSDAVQVGEWVLAVGNPFNLTSTVTAGIISAKARSTEMAGGSGNSRLGSFIQTDAAVNPGNSGGALVNSKGELIGINNMIYSQTGNYAGYAFAVPINTAAKVVSDIKKYGIVQRAVIGVVGTDVTPEIKEKYNLKVNSGAFVQDFAEISAAYAAGVEKEDVITHVNGKPVEDMGQLQSQIGLYRPGDKITLTVDRKGITKNFKVELKNSNGNTSVMKNSSDVLGAEFKPLSSDVMRKWGIRYGVEVTKVKDGKLKKAGIKPGFIILSVNDNPVNSEQDIRRIVSSVQNSNRKEKVLLIRGFGSDARIRYYEIVL